VTRAIAGDVPESWPLETVKISMDKVKLSLCLTKHLTIQMYGAMEI
jgi:hypothetical protein